MELLLGLVLLVWLGCAFLVVALCSAAARGDRVAPRHRERVPALPALTLAERRPSHARAPRADART